MTDDQIAASFGCVLTPMGAQHEDGEVWPESMADCPGGNEGAIVLLNELARADAARSRRVAAVADACRQFGDRLQGTSGGSDEATARAIQSFVQSSIAFREDPFQIFRPSDLTLLRGSGNCVNSARLTMATALAAGLSAQCVPVWVDGDLKHTCAQILVNGVWRWAEGTISADFGESPLDAVARGAEPCEFAA